jgi:GNAT superfamily N-acetyltransferase
MFDNELLKPFNMCSYTGLEQRKRHVFGQSVVIFECKETRRVRLLACDPSGAIVAGLLVNPYNRVRTYQIDAVYTLEEHRRLGIAKQLLAVARFTLGTIQHSENLTINGKAWRDSVEGLN